MQEQARASARQERAQAEAKDSVKESLKTAEIELCVGKQLSIQLLVPHSELAHRVGKMRRKFATQYGFVVPEIKLTDDLSIGPRATRSRSTARVVAQHELRVGEVLVLLGERPQARRAGRGDERAGLRHEGDVDPGDLRRGGQARGLQARVDNMSVLLTHLSEVIRNNLAQLLSYKDMRALLDRLDPEYKRLIEDICPSQISYSGLQAVLKLLLAERVSIRNLHLILEAIAEIAPHVRRTEQIAEHVRMRMAQQICGDLSDDGVLKVLRLGNRWDLAFHQSLKRDAKGEVVEFDIDPRLVEQFGTEPPSPIRKAHGAG